MGEYYLVHHGIRGMKWGVRRYQNKDGSLTPAGKKRLQKAQDEYKALSGKKIKTTDDDKKKEASAESTPKIKSVKDMSDQELQREVTRLGLEDRYSQLTKNNDGNQELRNLVERTRLEKEYFENKKRIAELNPEPVSAGKKFVDTMLKDVVAPAVKSSAKKLLQNKLDDLTNGLFSEAKDTVKKTVGDSVKDAKKTAEKQKAKADKKQAKKDNAERINPDDVTVEDGGSSRRQSSKSTRSRRNDGPIDVEYWYADEPTSNLPSVYTSSGRSYVDEILRRNRLR